MTQNMLGQVCKSLDSELRRKERDAAVLWSRIDTLEAMLAEIVAADEAAIEAMREIGVDPGQESRAIIEKSIAVLREPLIGKGCGEP